MIGYTTLGTNDILRAGKFYDALLAELGGKRAMEMPTFIAWASQPGGAMVAVIKPYDGKPNADVSKIDEIEFYSANSIHKTDRSQLVNG